MQDTKEQVLPNDSIVDSMLVSVLNQKIFELKGRETDTLGIKIGDFEPEVKHYLKILIGNLAVKNSFYVYRNYNTSSSFHGILIDLDLFDIGIFYSKPYSKSFLGRNYINRKVNINVRGQIYSAKSEFVYYSIEEKLQYEDEVLYRNIEKLETSGYNFMNGKRTDFSFWDKIFEPALAVTSVALIVYLFFSQRI